MIGSTQGARKLTSPAANAVKRYNESITTSIPRLARHLSLREAYCPFEDIRCASPSTKAPPMPQAISPRLSARSGRYAIAIPGRMYAPPNSQSSHKKLPNTPAIVTVSRKINLDSWISLNESPTQKIPNMIPESVWSTMSVNQNSWYQPRM